MTQSEFIVKLDEFWFKKYGRTYKSVADAYGVSLAFVSAVSRGKKDPSDQMLRDIGYMKETTKTVKYTRAN